MTSLSNATLTVDVETPSGWHLTIKSLPGGSYHAQLSGPETPAGYELFRWPTLDRVYESMEFHFVHLGLPHVWTALRAQVEAEIRP